MNKQLFPVFVKIFIGILVYYFLIGEGIYKAKQEFNKRDWITINGKIIQLVLQEKRDKESVSRSKMYVNTFLRYSYTVDNTEHIETEMIEYNKIYNRNSTLEELTKAKEEKDYPPGKSIAIRINPKHKEESTSVPVALNYIIVELGLGLVAELFLIFSIIRSLRKR